ncbi:MAG TPA: class I tRNA ligase family protein, partial [Dermatophilaceae bacterium]|nr:class I tRNA ligase family protein [Dermatophilaceae bacterium]
RDDMTALRVIPPDDYVGVVERLPHIEQAVTALVDGGLTYDLPVHPTDPGAQPSRDVYLDLTRQPSFGTVSGWSREEMMRVFADRGGDPDRPGKRTAFDPLLWRAARAGEPSWESARLGPGRPGWHIECTSIALDLLTTPFDIQGGGTDLVFPHHEMSAVQAVALTGDGFARGYVHQAMVGLDGQKMSKSRGNLVLVSRLLQEGVDPMAVRLALLAHHYRGEWQYTDDVMVDAQRRLECWRYAMSSERGGLADATIDLVRERLADDLDTPGALAAVDAWSRQPPTDAPSGSGPAIGTEAATGSTDPGAALAAAVDALLGVRVLS